MCLSRVIAAVLLVCVASAFGRAATPSGPRNVVVIMADDLGWGDVSCNGATAVQTPAIDRLAREGRRFTSGYSSGSTCTPTRYSFLTGEYAFRRKGTGIAPPNAAAIIPPGTPTIASVLKSAGRATAIVGKWHLGLGEPGRGPDWNGELAPGPLELGFDHCFILPTTNDRVPPVFVEGRRVKGLDPADPLWVGMEKPAPDHPTGIDRRDSLTMDWSHGHNQSVHNGIGRIGFVTGGTVARFRDEDLADTWVRESVRWIEARRNEPFFLFLASHDIHVPRVAPKRFQGKSPLGPRGDCILAFDWCVGEVTAALERLGLAADTLVIVCSDNGPVLDDGYKDGAVEKLGDHAPAGPFRGGKGGVFEGGTRTPFIAWWPGRIEPAVSDETVCTIDLGRSLAALVGATVPAEAFPDAVDVSGALVGATGAKGRAALVEQDNGAGRLGYREGRWKIVRSPPRKGPGPQRGSGADGARPGDALYDLDADPSETTDVAARHSDETARLGADLDRIVGGPADRARPTPAGGSGAPATSPAAPAPPAAAAPRETGPIRVLFIGNSYTHANDLPGMLKKLSAAARRRRVITGMEAPGGYTFEQHTRVGRAAAKIGADEWDYVVLQEQSMLPVVDAARTLEWGPKLDAAADARGAATLLYQTWARAGRPDMQDALVATYAELGRRCNATVVPVGEAWRSALALVPPPVLHVADGSHPTPAGTYLAACVFYAVIHGTTPVGLPGTPAGLEPAAARRLQEIAWQWGRRR